MCGRYVSATPPDQLAAYFGADVLTESVIDPASGATPEANYNVAPTTRVFTVTERDHQRVLDTTRWGLVPFWAKDPSVGSRMINARAETVATKNAYRKLIVSRRCIVPADGFYEWRRVTGDDGKQRKQPVYLHRADGEPLAFAGLWDRWTDAEGNELRSCTIITCAANAAIEEIHDRMPVVLAPAQWDAWLDPDMRDVEVATSMLVPAPEHLIVWHPVSTEVNNVRNKGAHLLDPVPAEGGGG